MFGVWLLWAIGLVELITHTSNPVQILGRYSYAYLATLIAYGVAGVALLGLVWRPQPVVTLFHTALSFIQSRGWLAVSLLIASLFVFHPLVIRNERFNRHSALMLIAIFLVLLVDGLIIFYGWRRQPRARWRVGAVAVIAVALLFEVSLQALSAARLLPSGFRTEMGLYWPYGRLYIPEGGLGNSIVNRYGWHAPEFAPGDDDYRVLIIGDEFVYAPDVARDAQFPALLEARLDADRPTEVLAIGAAGYGPQHYYEAIKVAIDQFQPDDVVYVINVRDDYFNLLPNLDPRSPGEIPYFVLEESGFWNLHPQSTGSQHRNFHTLTDSGLPLYRSLIRSVQSHILTPQLIRYWLTGAPIEPWAGGYALSESELAVAGGELSSLGKLRFILQTDPSDNATAAHTLLDNLIEISAQVARGNGATFKLATVPVVSDEFFAANAGSADGNWVTVYDRFDFLEPERRLQTFAADRNIPLLATAHQLEGDGVPAAELADWYTPALTTFTPEGHTAFAELLYQNLYNP